jgi:hypothetical protein
MNKEKMFIARDENNVDAAYEMLYVKNVDGTPIIWYTDGTVDENDNKNVFISSYRREENTFLLSAIEDDNLMNKYAEIFLNEYKEN